MAYGHDITGNHAYYRDDEDHLMSLHDHDSFIAMCMHYSMQLSFVVAIIFHLAPSPPKFQTLCVISSGSPHYAYA